MKCKYCGKEFRCREFCGSTECICKSCLADNMFADSPKASIHDFVNIVRGCGEDIDYEQAEAMYIARRL